MKKWDRNTITKWLQQRRAVEWAIIQLYYRQTEDERISSDTKHNNGRGFSGAHARLGSYYANWILAGNSLSGKHLDKARNITLKYTGQLLIVAHALAHELDSSNKAA